MTDQLKAVRQQAWCESGLTTGGCTDVRGRTCARSGFDLGYAAGRAELETLLCNLLARIFRDGGQRIDTFDTLEAAVVQADIEVAEYIIGQES